MSGRNRRTQSIDVMEADRLLERLDNAKMFYRDRINAAAYPGETFEQARARIVGDDKPARSSGREISIASENLSAFMAEKVAQWSRAGKSRENLQPESIVPTDGNTSIRDSRSIMDVAVYRLSKRDNRAGEKICYKLSDGYVEITAGSYGMATIWDYDIVIMMISYLTRAMNRYREQKCSKPGRMFRPHITDILKFLCRSNGGKQNKDLLEALLRLNTTSVFIKRSIKGKNGRALTVIEGEPLISRYQVILNSEGKPEYVEIEMAHWMYREVMDGHNPDVLSVHSDYFFISQGIGRFIYRLARRSAGYRTAKWGFETIYERSGSVGAYREFCRILRSIIKANELPEYHLMEIVGHSGPQLVMTNRKKVSHAGEGA
jgi:plasmid replication initiation protein